MLKTFLTAAIIACMLALISVAASEMADASGGELLLKLMAFITFILVDIYVIASMHKGNNNNNGNHNN